MNHIEAPRDDAEILRLMQDEDAIGAESSLWFRVFRQLIKDGKPIGQILLFTIPIGNGKNLPIGMLTLTDNNRLVFWPVLPRSNCVVINKPGMPLPDHITVEFPSERVHLTSYDADGRRLHVSDVWRSSPLENDDFRLLFTFFVRLDVLADQDVIVSRMFPMPQSDKNRRTAEISRCIERMVPVSLSLPGDPSESQYAGFSLYHASREMTVETLPLTLIPRPISGDMISDWPEHTDSPMAVLPFKIADQMFCLAAGLPPGCLKDELCLGLPRRERNSKG